MPPRNCAISPRKFGDGVRGDIDRGTAHCQQLRQDKYCGTAVKPYAADYYTCIEEAKQELNSQARPALKKYLGSISSYDNIFVCGPCWWGTFPMAVFIQLEKLNFSGKKVIAVMTREGRGLGSCERDLKRFCPGAVFGNGLAVHDADAAKSESTAAAWAKKALG